MTVKKLIEILNGVPENTSVDCICETGIGYEEKAILKKICIHYDSEGAKMVLILKTCDVSELAA